MAVIHIACISILMMIFFRTIAVFFEIYLSPIKHSLESDVVSFSNSILHINEATWLVECQYILDTSLFRKGLYLYSL